MSPILFRGCCGLIGTTLAVVIAFILHFVPGTAVSMASNGQTVYFNDFLTKIQMSTALQILLVTDFCSVNALRLAHIYVISSISAVAAVVIQRSLQFPLYLLNVWVFKKPGGDEYLETWNGEYMLVLALLLAAAALPVYFEMGVPNAWKRSSVN